ncbi:MAG: PIN domain-containing protein [Burkholderiaceae bacterium]|nr:PIN domain-containing protein [Burkholderiaceae bacterium]
MHYLLDTDICIYVINSRPAAVLERFLAHEADGLGVSAVTAGELYFGARKSGSRRNLLLLDKFLAPLEIAEYGADAARTYGELRSTLEKKGTPIGPLDTQIAAHALALDVTLVSNNLREFRRVPKLRMENWA